VLSDKPKLEKLEFSSLPCYDNARNGNISHPLLTVAYATMLRPSVVCLSIVYNLRIVATRCVFQQHKLLLTAYIGSRIGTFV